MSSSDTSPDAWYLKQIGVQTPIPDIEETPESSSKPVTTLVSLESLASQAADCHACTLAKERTQVVFGVGNPDAGLVFIGEAPGRDEDLKGEPFVGRAGKLLDRMLLSLGFDRSSAYIMNVVKCRPPQNRDPNITEVRACSRWFDAQLQALSPKIICLLGRIAAQHVLDTDAPLSNLRGRWHVYQEIPVWVTYHPAYLLRSPRQKARSWEDFQKLHERYNALTKPA